VAVAGVGPFGQAVADQLGGVTVAPRELPQTDADVLVMALWRPSPALCDRVDAAAFAAGRPWLPIIVEHPHVLVGPWVAPPAGPCFACYTARRTQHDPSSRATAGLHTAYDADPALGPAGYLPHHVRVAAALALLALDRRAAGQLSAYNVQTGQLSAQRLVGVHACPRCDAGRREPGDLPGFLADALGGPLSARSERASPGVRTGGVL
jgi:bacteriocin biosynthesis cyclodehydratase domain-containing protein